MSLGSIPTLVLGESDVPTVWIRLSGVPPDKSFDDIAVVLSQFGEVKPGIEQMESYRNPKCGCHKGNVYASDGTIRVRMELGENKLPPYILFPEEGEMWRIASDQMVDWDCCWKCSKPGHICCPYWASKTDLVINRNLGPIPTSGDSDDHTVGIRVSGWSFDITFEDIAAVLSQFGEVKPGMAWGTFAEIDIRMSHVRDGTVQVRMKLGENKLPPYIMLPWEGMSPGEAELWKITSSQIEAWDEDINNDAIEEEHPFVVDGKPRLENGERWKKGLMVPPVKEQVDMPEAEENNVIEKFVDMHVSAPNENQ